MRKILKAVGVSAISRLCYLRDLSATAFTVFLVMWRRETWKRTVRDVLARQILFTGVEASRFVVFIALLIGVSVVVQAQLWLNRVGQSALLGPILVAVLIRELGPLLVNFIVIGRSGTAIATELGSMSVSGEVRLLDSLGLDPMIYLVWPRVVGVTVSVFCLSVLFVAFSFVSGFVSGLFLGGGQESPLVFVRSVFKAITPADVTNFIAKSFFPGVLTGTICCLEGLSASSRHEIPIFATRAVVKSVTALFLTMAVISVLTYA